ncbi:MAG: glycoside hydrolase family 2 TIM barrel-domain containing protein [Prevotella sp.]|nr:glycoside hydrolase family 2 TIM barrel-domain containing protein [Prevotella sp.]
MFNNTNRTLFAAILLSLLPSLGFAVSSSIPTAGKTYYISLSSDETDAVLSTHNFTWLKETGLVFEALNSGNDEQKWVVREISGTPGSYQLVNASTGLAVDMALNSKDISYGYPCVWASTPSNKNQQLTLSGSATDGYTISAVSQKDGATYYITSYYTSSYGGSFSTCYTVSKASEATKVYFLETTPAAEKKANDWENAKVFERNKEAGHATYMPYSSTTALHADKARYDKPWTEPTGANYMSLNGTWKLKWNEAQTVTLLDSTAFWGNDVSTAGSDWKDIPVPSCLEMQGYGQAMYINVDYPFNDNPPYIQMRNVNGTQLLNSVGSYRRDFDLPAGWDSKRVFLHFDGIYSAAYVYVNGKEVGYTEGANNVSEFDITKYVRKGKNNVSVAVIRWSDGSYIEDQDMWRMSGIHRDVYLVATPKTYIADHYIQSTVTPGAKATAKGSAKTQVKLTVCNRDKAAVNKTIDIRFISPDGQTLKTVSKEVSFNQGDSVKTVTADFGTLSNLSLWSAETPTLYTFEVSQSANGQEEEAFATKYGFCKVDLSAGYLKINGKRTYLKGVNTQDTDPKQGRTYGVDLMLKDITMMKQANMNTVRTSHYPRQAKMMAMFDYYGMYIVDEADMESHKNWNDNKGLMNNTDWQGTVVDRNVRNTLRDRNHPSVVFWSLGNESGSGLNIIAAYNAVRNLDARPIHYEGATRDRAEGTDLHSVMYPSMTDWRSGSTGPVTNDVSNPNTGKPYFMCEYAHAMGNAVGNLKEYWDAMKDSKMGVGGCIWDWVDQSIYPSDAIKSGDTIVNGFPKYITGFDCPGPHQYNFVNNGLINADRSWSSELDEVKRIYQWVDFSLNQTNKQMTLKNNYLDRNLSDFTLQWTLLVDGELQQSGSSALSCEPGKTQTVTLDYDLSNLSGKDVFLNTELVTNEATSWCDKGYAIAQAQDSLQGRATTFASTPATSATLNVATPAAGGRTYSNDDMSVTFDNAGNITAWTYKGQNLFLTNGGPKYDNYRFVENDGPTEPYNDESKIYFTNNGVSSQTANFTINSAKTKATVKVTQDGRNCSATYTYTVYADGTIDVKNEYTVKGTNTRRMGVSVDFPRSLQNVTYYARGPRASYIDRKDGEDYGIYKAKADSLYEPFAKPQSSGNHLGLRWMTLVDNNGKGVKVETLGDVAFSLNPWNDATLRNTLHEWQLPESDSIVAHFDAIQKGLGNGSCGPSTMDTYTIHSGDTYSNTLRFSPFGFDGGATGISTITTGNSGLTITADEHSVIVRGSVAPGTEVKVFSVDGRQLAAKTTTTTIEGLTLPVGSYRGVVVVRLLNGAQTLVKKLTF